MLKWTDCYQYVKDSKLQIEQAEKLKSCEMEDEGWKMNDESWKMKVESWRKNVKRWRIKVEGGFEDGQTDKQTDEQTNGHLWL